MTNFHQTGSTIHYHQFLELMIILFPRGLAGLAAVDGEGQVEGSFRVEVKLGFHHCEFVLVDLYLSKSEGLY